MYTAQRINVAGVQVPCATIGILLAAASLNTVAA
jgi:hypothetical protein